MNNNETSSPDVAGEIPPAPSDISSANTPADSAEEQVKLYYVFRGDVEEGPYTEEMLKRAADSGQVQESTYVRCEGMTEWQTYRQVFAASLPVEESHATLTVQRLKEMGDACMQTARQFAEKMLPFSKKIGAQALGKVKQGLEAVQNMDLKEGYDKLQSHELTKRAKGMVEKYLPKHKRKYAAGIALVVLAGVAALCLTSPHEEMAVAETDAYFGQGREDNEQIDVKGLQIDAEQGNVDSQYKMGVIYFKGMGVERDLKAAAQWWKQAAEQGHSESAYLLGAMYAKGFTLHSDEKAVSEAMRWYTFAAEQGNARAQYELGMYYLSSDWDSKRAVQLLEASAEQGYHKASYILGCLYFQGEHGVRQHIGKAKFYLQKAAEQGNGAAANALNNIKNLY